ncbi:E3 ubiquitin-protein ligase KCMF1-like isoform X2 [Babylonia areolata]|uniref:E3 ubiquitin-protein ligase KCMF1-like isoform X2 n=1 Tax=Babylonia areolata TaxID=304850 RepID=UPI003FD411EB
MSRHEGVSCDSCLKGNFRGRRYKCLICYDYDLCATCYEAGATTTRHTTDHPVQCILTRSDFDMYYGGEALTAEQPQSFTCPFCCKMGFTDTTLQEHVSAEHTDVSNEVVCPVCASLPGGDPNHMTDDLASHLSLDHRSPRDFDEPPGLRHVRRIPHPGRGGGSRTRRGNMHFGLGSSTNTLTGLSPSGRENMDPIAELLSQLSSVRSRAAAAQSVSSQLQQLEMQLQSTRQQLERMPRRQGEVNKIPPGAATAPIANPESGLTSSQSSSTSESQYLLPKVIEESQGASSKASCSDPDRVEKNHFLQELLLSTLTENLRLDTLSEDPVLLLESLSSPQSRSPIVPSSVTTGSVGVLGTGSSAMGSDGARALGRVTVVEAQCKSKGSAASSNVVGGGKSTSSTSPTPGSSRLPRAVSPVGAVSESEGRNVATVMMAASGSSHPSSRPSLLAAGPTSAPSQPHGSTVNLNEHAMNDPPPPPPRQAAGSLSPRDASRLNPAAAKRGMLKHVPASRGGATDMDPPPH